MHFSLEKSSLLFNKTFYRKGPVLIYLHAGYLFMLSFSLLAFSKSSFLQINHLGVLSDCQTVGIQIKLDILLVFKLFAKAISRRQNSLLAC